MRIYARSIDRTLERKTIAPAKYYLVAPLGRGKVKMGSWLYCGEVGGL